MVKQNMLSKFIDSIQMMNLGENDKSQILKNLTKLKETKVNILIAGGTGAGKSSTINALFDIEKARVGIGVKPQTMEIAKYELDNIVLWDSPGLGDGKEADENHAIKIIDKLRETDSKGELLIDLVLVILDGSSRDFGTSYQLINEVIIPNLGKDKTRLLIAMNKIDRVEDEDDWDREKNEPSPEWITFLDKQVEIVRERIREATGVNVTPVYYSAGGYSKKENKQKPAYNLSKLLAFILRHTDKKKRILIAQDLNQKKEVWKKNDKVEVYQKEIEKSFMDSFVDNVTKGTSLGSEIGGAILGTPGKMIGAAAGAIIGGIASLFSWW